MTKPTKTPSTASFSVRNDRTGQIVTVRGAGSLKNSGFAVRKGIDLTQPIAQQALRARTRKTAKTPVAS